MLDKDFYKQADIAERIISGNKPEGSVDRSKKLNEFRETLRKKRGLKKKSFLSEDRKAKGERVPSLVGELNDLVRHLLPESKATKTKPKIQESKLKKSFKVTSLKKAASKIDALCESAAKKVSMSGKGQLKALAKTMDKLMESEVSDKETLLALQGAYSTFFKIMSECKKV